MATTIKQSFSDYACNLEITDKQSSTVGNCRANAVKKLKNELTLHPDESKVIGSWDRNTLTRYLSEGDVDVMVLLHYGKHKDWDNPDGTIRALDKVKAILAAAYPNTPTRRDENCITMELSQFRLDVVPAFCIDNGRFKIPDSMRKQWLSTDPISFAANITVINKTMNGRFVPLIKMVKGWNREQGWPIRSFHLECVMYNRYSAYTTDYTYSSMVKCFFADLPQYLSFPAYDPITNERVDSYLDNFATPTRRQVAIAKARNAALKSELAFANESTNPELAISQWKTLLGEFFPAYG